MSGVGYVWRKLHQQFTEFIKKAESGVSKINFRQDQRIVLRERRPAALGIRLQWANGILRLDVECGRQVAIPLNNRACFESESFREGLELVTRTINNSTALTDARRKIIAGLAIKFLVNRLRIAYYARRHPEILSRPIERPLVILGVPRTGTTALSHLLSLDPSRRPLLDWEAPDSVPPPTQETLRTDPRCLALKEENKTFLDTPAEMHFLQPDLPTECIISHAHDFKSILWYGIAENPEYTKWLIDCDMTSAYAFHKLQLQVLQAHTHGRWTLKAPAHSLAIPTLRKFYLDARIIWTHRDPYTAFASACSFTGATRATFAEFNQSAMGESFLALFTQHLARPMAYHAKAGSGSLYNLHYVDFMRDPIGEVRKIYDWLGDPLSPELETRFHKWVAQNKKGKFGKHSYDLERFALTKEMLRPRFADYIARYNVTLDS